MPHKHRHQRHEWIKGFLAFARWKGDRRSSKAIIDEKKLRDEIIDLAFEEAYRDREIKETVVNKGCDYPIVDLREGEVLTHSLVFIHPVLARS
jgi:hypothetical protein